MDTLKTEGMDCLERSWNAPGKFVCADCVNDDFLKNVINQNLVKRKCKYCGKGSRSRGYIAAPVGAIMEPIASALFHCFNDHYHAGLPDELDLDELPTTAEALRGIPLECHETLLKDVATAFWCDRWVKNSGSFHDPGTSMSISWGKFVRTVKHGIRYFFSSVEPKYRFYFEKSPAELLQEIGRIAAGQKLIRPLQAETNLFRVRYWPPDPDNDWCLDEIEKNLGAPPNEKALSGRMNPAGISYLYLGKDRATALAEVLNKPPCSVAIGSFKTRRDLLILDLGKLPEIPSIFNSERYHERELIIFLKDFVKKISKPVQKNSLEHLDYIPSQVVCEYFAKVFKTEENAPIDGIAYPSAIRPSGTNIVLFPPESGRDGFNDLVELRSSEELVFHDWNDFHDAIR